MSEPSHTRTTCRTSDFDPSFTIEGKAEPPKLADKGRSAMRAVTPDYFGILEIPVLEGRAFRLSENLELDECLQALARRKTVRL